MRRTKWVGLPRIKHRAANQINHYLAIACAYMRPRSSLARKHLLLLCTLQCHHRRHAVRWHESTTARNTSAATSDLTGINDVYSQTDLATCGSGEGLGEGAG